MLAGAVVATQLCACGGKAVAPGPPPVARNVEIVSEPEQPGARPRVFTLAVGVSRHQRAELSLDYADRDAEAVDGFYASPAGGSVPKERRLLLRNEDATRGKILVALQEITARALDIDLLVVFLAMHGVPDGGDRLYFVAHDSDPNNLLGTGLPESEIDYVLSRARVKRILVLIDACHSGAMGTAGVAKKRDVASADTNRLIERIAASRPGVALLAAARAAETSQEDRRWGGGHGVFTHHVLQGLGGSADADGDGIVSVAELVEHVQRAVPADTNGAQHPQVTGRFDNRMPVAIAARVERPRAASANDAAPSISCPEHSAWDGKRCVGEVACSSQMHFDPKRGCVADEVKLASGEAGDPSEGLSAQVEAIKLALKADREGKLDECIAHDKRALAIEEAPRTRLHLASCQARAGRLVEALVASQKSLEVAIRAQDAETMRVARARVKELIERVPHVTFVPPIGVTELEVLFDDRPVPIESLTKRFSVDPGAHVVVAQGKRDGRAVQLRTARDVAERDLATFDLREGWVAR